MESEYANFSTDPPYSKRRHEPFYDRGQGVPKMTENSMTIQDIYRTPFLFLQEHRKNYKNMSSTALKGIQSDSELSKIYFSDKNIKRLQAKIREEIFKRTNGQYKLDVDQEQRELLITMRAVYIEHGKFLPTGVIRQAKKLNDIVVEEVVPGMITEIKQYYGYLKDVNNPIKPIQRPINVSNAGRRTLPAITSVWGVN